MSQVPNNSTGERSTNDTTGIDCGVWCGDGTDVSLGDGEGVEPKEENGDSRGDSLDDIFRTLAVQRRRNVLYVLYRRTSPISLADLVEEVAVVEESDRERVATSLRHVHLPKLVEGEFVDYDAETETVRFTDYSDPFHHFLVRAAEDERHFLGPTDDAVSSE